LYIIGKWLDLEQSQVRDRKVTASKIGEEFLKLNSVALDIVGFTPERSAI
jgi:hypothetical protein